MIATRFGEWNEAQLSKGMPLHYWASLDAFSSSLDQGMIETVQCAMESECTLADHYPQDAVSLANNTNSALPDSSAVMHAATTKLYAERPRQLAQYFRQAERIEFCL